MDKKEIIQNLNKIFDSFEKNIKDNFIEELIQKLKLNKEKGVFEIDLKEIEKYKPDLVTKEKRHYDKIILGFIFGFSVMTIIIILICLAGGKLC